jgi:bifunctional DNase/RNase
VTGTVEFNLRYIIFFETHSSAALYLLEAGGSRIIFIVTDYYAGVHLLPIVKNEQHERPLTIAAIGLIIKALGGVLEDVVLTDYDNRGHYHVLLRIRQGESLVTADTRPSDALALATLCAVPFLVAREVCSKVAYY